MTALRKARTCFIIKLLEDTVQPVLAADGALLRSHRQAGEPSAQEHGFGRHLVDFSKELQKTKKTILHLEKRCRKACLHKCHL